MAIIAEIQNPNGRKVTAPLNILYTYEKGWYLTDIPLGNQSKSMQYHENLKLKYPSPKYQWQFMGKTTRYSDSGEYREDGSILYKKENEGYSRIWYMTELTGIEEDAAILENSVLVFPSYKNTANSVSAKKYNYIYVDGNIVDAITLVPLKTIATIHTHPGGEEPSDYTGRTYGDLDFAVKITPYKPVYVLQMNNENKISFIAAAAHERVIEAKKMKYNLTDSLPYESIDNLLSGKFGLRHWTKMTNFKNQLK